MFVQGIRKIGIPQTFVMNEFLNILLRDKFSDLSLNFFLDGGERE